MVTDKLATDELPADLPPLEHYARAQMMGLAYDQYTQLYRPLSPGGQKYKYTGCVCARTLDPMPGMAIHLERLLGIGNVVSRVRLGLGGTVTRIRVQQGCKTTIRTDTGTEIEVGK